MATIDEAALLEPQARCALSHYDLPEPTKLDLLTFSENAVFRAYFGNRESVIIRLHSVGYHTKAAVESELAWVEAIRADTDIIVPPVLHAAARDSVVVATHPAFPPRLAAVFGDLPGEPPAADNIIADYRVLGRTTAHLHNHASSWTPPASFQRLSWDLEWTLGDRKSVV